MSTPKPWSELATRIAPERRAELDAEVEALAGEDFMARLHAAVQRPAWPESVMEALSEGPEICGGYDADPAIEYAKASIAANRGLLERLAKAEAEETSETKRGAR